MKNVSRFHKQQIMKNLILISLTFLLSSCAAQQNSSQASNELEFDTWIQNGLVLMPDGTTQNADIFIKDGIIVKVETDIVEKATAAVILGAEEALNPDLKVNEINAKGNFVMPGFIDAHAHFIALGKNKANLDFLGTTSWEQIVQMVKEKVKKTPKGQWITGRGWHQEKWANLPSELVEGFPVHDALSKISPNHPVVLSHASGHGLIANAKAMELAGITTKTKVPNGGVMLLKEDGNPSGVFQENAMELLYSALENSKKNMTEAEKDAEWMKYFSLAVQECLSQGITTVHDAGIGWGDARKFKDLAENNDLNIRIYSMLSDYTIQNTDKTLLKNHIEATRNNRFFTNTAVKAYMDGALGSRGAWLLEDYSDLPGYHGENVTSIASLTKTAQISKDLNLQLCIHAIGDRGNREVIDVFEEVMGNDLSKSRWRIEHAQHLNPEDIDRIADLDILASMQTVHCTSDAPYVVKRLGEKRAEEGAYVWQTLLQKNVHIANGTDAPIERINPFENLYAAVTRKRLDTGLEFYPNQKLSREKALEIYTQGNAYAAFQEDWKGKVEAGYVADLVILDTNLLTCNEAEIPTTQVLYTIVNGKVRFQAKE